MTKLLFWIEKQGTTVKDADEFEIKWFDGDISSAAEEYAEYYYSERDGWEDDWPIEFSVADFDGKFLGKVSVEQEHDPVFHGRIVPEAQVRSDAKD